MDAWQHPWAGGCAGDDQTHELCSVSSSSSTATPCSASLCLWWHKDTFRPFDKSQAWLLFTNTNKTEKQQKRGGWVLLKRGLGI